MTQKTYSNDGNTENFEKFPVTPYCELIQGQFMTPPNGAPYPLPVQVPAVQEFMQPHLQYPNLNNTDQSANTYINQLIVQQAPTDFGASTTVQTNSDLSAVSLNPTQILDDLYCRID
jgi:hypothetical protein